MFLGENIENCCLVEGFQCLAVLGQQWQIRAFLADLVTECAEVVQWCVVGLVSPLVKVRDVIRCLCAFATPDNLPIEILWPICGCP